jgi:hypothetical protein
LSVDFEPTAFRLFEPKLRGVNSASSILWEMRINDARRFSRLNRKCLVFLAIRSREPTQGGNGV